MFRLEIPPYTHPGDPNHVMRTYRRYILEHKRKWGGVKRVKHRGLIKYRAILLEYLAAKRLVAN